MSKRVTVLFAICLLALAMASPALATTSRVISLAGTGDYINDDSNVFRWYGVLPSYANLVMSEVGTYVMNNATDQALGLTYSCGENGRYGTWGIFLMRNVSDMGFLVFSPIRALSPGEAYNPETTNPVNKLALAFGKEFGKLAVGLNFTRSDESIENKQTTPSSTTSSSYTTIGAGVRADLGEKAYADVAITYARPSADTVDFDKKTALDFAGRLFYE